ncbi:hypothetical protein Pan258_23410 [Symmachiella dynata]|nr:hypothetical protein Pan258_23410 [Symmachiella dynata]
MSWKCTKPQVVQTRGESITAVHCLKMAAQTQRFEVQNQAATLAIFLFCTGVAACITRSSCIGSLTYEEGGESTQIQLKGNHKLSTPKMAWS